nr:amidohydrolase family protein [Spelaeicoccus albus]
MFDVHTHFMPTRVLDKVWRYFETNTRFDWPITYRQDEDERVRRLRDLGVRRFTAMLYPHKPDMAHWLNRWGADFAARTPDCLHTATFFPEPGNDEYVREALGAGARVFKAHVQVGGYDPSDRLLDGVWAQLEDAGVPTVIHCGSGPNPGKFTGPEPIRAVLRRHPRLRLIIAHLGMPEYEDFAALAEGHDGVYLDTTMNFTDFTEKLMPMPDELLPRLAALQDKILLGSDFPNIPYPYAHQIDALTRLGFGDEWLRAVLWHNAAGLFAEY